MSVLDLQTLTVSQREQVPATSSNSYVCFTSYWSNGC